jgi:hypothetical protein
MGIDDEGDPRAGQTEEAVETEEDGMDFEESTEEFVRNMEKHFGSTSLQKEAARASTSTSTSTSTTATVMATGMKKIEEEDEEEEEEEEIQGTKTRNWRKINLSFAIELDGEDGDDIRAPDQLHEGNNDNKMKHHPIMSKIAKCMYVSSQKEM